MIRINLLPVRAAQKKEKLVSQLLILVAALVLTITACAGIHFLMLSKVDAQQAKVDQVRSELSSLRKKIGEVGRFKKLQKELQAKLDVLNKLKEGRTGPVHLLDELTMALPEKVWLDSFRESGGKVSIEGTGLNEEAVAEFMQNLESSEYYQNIELRVVEQRGTETKTHVFSLTASVDRPADEGNDSAN